MADLAEWTSLFVLLVCVHFVADWVFQSHRTAMRKSSDMGVLYGHCVIYLAFFAPFFVLCQASLWRMLAAAMILLVSHLVGDLYIPVYVWARWIRRILLPEGHEEWSGSVLGELARKPRNLVLFIVIDQIWHIAWLWPVVALMEVPGA